MSAHPQFPTNRNDSLAEVRIAALVAHFERLERNLLAAENARDAIALSPDRLTATARSRVAALGAEVKRLHDAMSETEEAVAAVPATSREAIRAKAAFVVRCQAWETDTGLLGSLWADLGVAGVQA